MSESNLWHFLFKLKRMSNYTMKVQILEIFETQQITDKFKKREVVCSDMDESYPQMPLFQFTQEKCDLLDNYKKGDVVVIHFNIKGREWINPKTKEPKYFVSLEGWRIEGEGSKAAIDEANESFKQDDDLPF